MTRTEFDQVCAGPISGDTMALLENAQHSQRRLAFRALVDQLRRAPQTIGRLVDPEGAWRIIAAAEQRDPGAVADLLMYPTVGVWLTRALHYTRPGTTAVWPELGYLHLIAAAAAIRTGHRCAVRVPVWRGVVSLPTVGHVRVPGTFPVGSAEVSCAGHASRLRLGRTVSMPLDGSDSAFTPARQHTTTANGSTLRAWVDDHDPYHGFAEPRPPADLTDVMLSEWHKLLDEAWDVLVHHHPAYARELTSGLRALMPIGPGGDTVGASSPAAFGGIRLSADGTATEFAEAMVHEMQHSKLNALMTMVRLGNGDNERRYLAPWRDDPRPLVGLIHGVYAFTCGVEFWLSQSSVVAENEARTIDFDMVRRRLQVRRALDTITASGLLTAPGQALVDVVSARLAVCEEVPVHPALSATVTAVVDDHQALWRLRHTRPDARAVSELVTAWLGGAAPPAWPGGAAVGTDDERRLPANRRNLLRAKATDPELFRSLVRSPTALPGTTPRADAALCTGDFAGAAHGYEDRLRADADDVTAWAGLGLALRAQGNEAASLLEQPEVTFAVYRGIRARGSPLPAASELATWVNQAL
ncbi:HEXXH motif domain-containing protein [Actinophytocola glycyrrhizae]|uniref:HEXXH motif domain-containing protein n=1 Tax=Actinophytocola glycyrrhizae TaxID=2044873 RepID=A0ABV9S4F2_9PSEU